MKILPKLLAVAVPLLLAAVPSTAAAIPPCERPVPPPICTDGPPPKGNFSLSREADPAQTRRTDLNIIVQGMISSGEIGMPVQVHPVGGTTITLTDDGDGFSTVVPAGTRRVCVTAGPGQTAIGCKDVDVQPFGAFDYATRVPGGVRVQGWVIDPDTSMPLWVHAYVDGNFNKFFYADTTLPESHTYTKTWGRKHGVDTTVPVGAGRHEICLWAINAGAGDGNPNFGCKTVDVRFDPAGAFDLLERTGDRLRVAGWALDEDVADAIDVQVAIDGRAAGTLPANGSRPDVGALYPVYGNHHGFDGTVPANLVKGEHKVCVTAVNRGAGTSKELSCRTYRVYGPPSAPSELSAIPSDTTATLTWRDNADDETETRVERSLDGVEWKRSVQFTSSSTPTYTIGVGGLTPDTRNCFRVTMSNAYGSTTSPATCVMTLKPALAAATNVSVTGTSPTAVTVEWLDNAAGEDRTVVSLKGPGGGEVQATPITGTPGTGTQRWIASGLTPSTEYCAEVRVEKAGHASAASAAKPCAKTLAHAPSIAAFTAAPGTVQVCQMTGIALRWDVAEVARVVIQRDGAQILDRSAPGRGVWKDSFTDSRDRGGTYTLIAYGLDGRQTQRTVSVGDTSQWPVINQITFKNNTDVTLGLGALNAQGVILEGYGTLAPGQSTTIKPRRCAVTNIVAVDANGVRWESKMILGHAEGASYSSWAN